jgi:hypothetical protein
MTGAKGVYRVEQARVRPAPPERHGIRGVGGRLNSVWGCKPKPQKIPSSPYGSVATVSVLPEVVEAIRSELSIEGSVLDILVSKVVLNGAGVLAVVCEFEAGRMAKHVGMDWHAQSGHVAGAGEEFAEGRGGHRRPALGDKDIGCFRVVAQHFAESA